MSMEQQRSEIVLLGRGHPDRWKPIFDQQLQQQVGITSVVFLAPGLRLPNGCGMSNVFFIDDKRRVAVTRVRLPRGRRHGRQRIVRMRSEHPFGA